MTKEATKRHIRRLKRDIQRTKDHRDSETEHIRFLRSVDMTNTILYRDHISQRKDLNRELATYRSQLRHIKSKGEKG